MANRYYPERATLPRNKGIHLSELIRRMAVVNGMLAEGEQSEDDMPLRMFLGMAWEEAAATLYPEMLWQPGEKELDGIWGNCDGLSYESLEIDGEREEVLCVDEFKLTWKSQSRDIMLEWMWLQQGAGYCKMHGTRWVKYHVCWVNGNYRDSRDPVYMRYLVEFGERELAGIWKHFKAVKKMVEGVGEPKEKA